MLSLAALLMCRPAIRRLRALKEEGPAFRERWRQLDPARRREILRAIRRGQPVTDPQEAELALEAIRNGERVAAAVQPFQLLYPPALVAFTVYAFAEHSRFLIVFGAVLVGLVAATWLLQWQRTRRRRSAAAATRARGAAQ